MIKKTIATLLCCATLYAPSKGTYGDIRVNVSPKEQIISKTLKESVHRFDNKEDTHATISNPSQFQMVLIAFDDKLSLMSYNKIPPLKRINDVLIPKDSTVSIVGEGELAFSFK